MHLAVDAGRLVLADLQTFDRFHVVRPADGDPDRFARLLREEAAGEVVGEHVQVSTEWLRRQAPDEAWLARLDGMLAYASSKGWTDEAGTWVRAHVEAG